MAHLSVAGGGMRRAWGMGACKEVFIGGARYLSM